MDFTISKIIATKMTVEKFSELIKNLDLEEIICDESFDQEYGFESFIISEEKVPDVIHNWILEQYEYDEESPKKNNSYDFSGFRFYFSKYSLSELSDYTEIAETQFLTDDFSSDYSPTEIFESISSAVNDGYSIYYFYE